MDPGILGSGPPNTYGRYPIHARARAKAEMAPSVDPFWDPLMGPSVLYIGD